MSVKEMVEVYQVPELTIHGLLAHERETGTMGVDTSRNDRPPALDDAGLAKMKKIIEDQPDIPLEEIKEKMGLSICISAICRIVKYKPGFNYKKNTPCE
jgi:transposase